MRRYAIILIYMCVCCAYVQNIKAQGSNVIDEIVWIVGDEAIYKSEVEDARMQAQLRGIRWEGDPYCIIPEELAINKLYLNQAQLDSIDVASQDVYSQLDYTIDVLSREYGGTDKLEEYYGMTVNQIRERMYESTYNDMVSNLVQAEITKRVKVTPAEVRRYFKDADPDMIPFVPTQVEVQIITQDPIIPQEEIDAVKAELREYTERVQSGETQFYTLARFYSEDTESARRGGELGFMGRGELVPEFATVAFNLTDPQKVSKIVESEYGFHIIQLIEKRGDRVNVRHILRKPYIPESSITESLERLDSIANVIRSGKESFDDAATRLSSDKDTRFNKGLMMYHPQGANTSLSRFEMQQLPQEVARVVNNLHIGEISEPFTMVTEKGKTVCAIVKLKSRINGHKANMADDYQVLQDIVVSEKMNETIKKWVENKQRTTYVKIFDGWNSCDFKYPGWVIQ